MHNKIKRLFALLMAVILCVSVIPTIAFAAGDSGILRVLYKTFTSDMGGLPSIGHITTLPAKSMLLGGIYKAAYCLN